MEKVTKQQIIQFVAENDILLLCTQQKLCVPIIDRIYRKMLVGIRFNEIKIDTNLICDGHHRYIASLLANYPIETALFVKTSATIVVDWKLVYFEEEDWDTSIKIKMLNENDADYNNIPLIELEKMLR